MRHKLLLTTILIIGFLLPNSFPQQKQIPNAKNQMKLTGEKISKDWNNKQNVSLSSQSPLSLTITALIQGLYNGSIQSSVNPITVKVELHDATTKDGIEAQNGILSSTGVGTFNFNSAVNGTPYYIVIKSSNTIETWSANTQSFSSGTLSYDFTTSASKAYGNNLALVGSKYCIYSGDITQDGLVDLSDLAPVDNDNRLAASGNVITDLNGDGLVDLSDLLIVDNNNMLAVASATPSGVPPESFNYAGQTYHTVLIGTQYWLKENLNIGTMISGSQSQANNSIIEKYCYNDLSSNCATYGGLYQWGEAMQYAASGIDIQGICPTGWHLPTSNEISYLDSAVTGNSDALKSKGWGVDIGAGTNSSGFSAFLAGLRLTVSGAYSSLGTDGDGYFWSSTESSTRNANYMDLSAYDNTIYQYSVAKDYGFSVRCVKNGWISLQSPNGGESWGVDSTQNITWTSSNVANIKLEFTTDNGTTWSTISASTPATQELYSWVIPHTPSTQCKVKLSAVSDTTIQSISANVFTTWVPTISITSPIGGENWKVNDIDSIKWVSTHTANAKIEFTTDNGTNWTTIIASTPASTGNYNWTVPFTPSINCRVRVSNVSNLNINSTSPNVFTISNPSCPGIDTVVYEGQTYNTVLIGNQCWLKENLNVGTRINGIVAQTNNGIVEKYCYNNNPANCTTYGGLYEWAEAVQYQNGASNSTSLNPPLYGHIQGICPTGWHLPDTTELSTLTNAVNNDGNSLKAIGQGFGSAAGTDLNGFSGLLAGTRYSDGSWGSLGLYTFYVNTTEADAANVYYIELGTDFSNILFDKNSKEYGRSVRCIKDGSLSLQSPNGGESKEVGSTQNISWISSYVTNTKLEYSTNNGTSWTTIISSTPASAGNYSWTIPNTPSTQCKVKISDANDTTLKSISANVFTIVPLPSVTITSPIGSEDWKVGETDSIKWTSVNVTNVKLEYTTDNGTSWGAIVASTSASAGLYTWTIPNTPSVNCKVRISDAADTTINSTSANVFTIETIPVPTISINTPNGGEDWKVSDADSIKWTSSNVSNVKIEYSTDNGGTWSTIIASTPASAELYIWTIPDTPSVNCKIRISDADNSSINSESLNIFTISSPI